MNDNPEKGQAILELAIFGAILIMLLGILLNYGLRYGYQQQTMQFAFRKALQASRFTHTPTVSHVIVKDRHIPNPSDPFGVGSVTAFSSSASVIRSDKLDESPDDDSEVPHTWINVEDASINSYTTAAFRWQVGEYDKYKDSKRKFEEVYGVGNVWRIQGGDGKDWQTPLDWKTGEPLQHIKNVNKSRPTYYRYLDWLNRKLPIQHLPPPALPEQRSFYVAIIDYAWGQILDYDSALRQCRLIKDGDAFMTSCQRGGTPESDCQEIWEKPMDDPDYCEGCGERDADGRYVCPKLKQLFDQTRFRSMGLQEDYVQQPRIDNRLDKIEDSSGITTIDTFDQRTEIRRKIFYKPHGTAATKAVEKSVVTGDERDDAAWQNRKRSWFTPW